MTDPALTAAIRAALITYMLPDRALENATKACAAAVEAYWEKCWTDDLAEEGQLT